MATRTQRLGHIDPVTTMGYTHAIPEEDRKVSSSMGKTLSHAFTQSKLAKEVPEQLCLQLFETEAQAGAD